MPVSFDDILTANGSFGLTEDQRAGSAIASASTLNINTATTKGGTHSVTGTTTITTITLASGRYVTLIFAGALTLTHNASNLILPGGVNITTAAGDTCLVLSIGTNQVRVLNYQRADGTALAGAGASVLDPSFAYVRSNGNDATAVVGNASFPYLTAQAAFTAGARYFDLGVGSFTMTPAINTNYNFFVRGAGYGTSFTIAAPSTNNGASTSGAWTVDSDYTALLTLRNNGSTGVGGDDAAEGSGDDGAVGGTGGNGGDIAAFNCLVDFFTAAGEGGAGGAGDGAGLQGETGANGTQGTIDLYFCRTRSTGGSATFRGGSLKFDTAGGSTGWGTLYVGDSAGSVGDRPVGNMPLVVAGDLFVP